MSKRWAWRRVFVAALLICFFSIAFIGFTVNELSGWGWFAFASESELADASEESPEDTLENMPKGETQPNGQSESAAAETSKPEGEPQPTAEQESSPVPDESPTPTGGEQLSPTPDISPTPTGGEQLSPTPDISPTPTGGEQTSPAPDESPAPTGGEQTSPTPDVSPTPAPTGEEQPTPSAEPSTTPTDGIAELDALDALAESPLPLMSEAQAPQFTITIPANMPVSANGGEISVHCEITVTGEAEGAEGIESAALASNPGTGEVIVNVTSANGFNLMHEGGSESVSYALDGGDDLRFTQSGTKTLSLRITGTPRYAGTYTDTLTFTVATD